MDQMFAELTECTCIAQGREGLAREIIEKHVAKLFLAGKAAPVSLSGDFDASAMKSLPGEMHQIAPSAQDLDAVAAEHKAADDTQGA